MMTSILVLLACLHLGSVVVSFACAGDSGAVDGRVSFGVGVAAAADAAADAAVPLVAEAGLAAEAGGREE